MSSDEFHLKNLLGDTVFFLKKTPHQHTSEATVKGVDTPLRPKRHREEMCHMKCHAYHAVKITLEKLEEHSAHKRENT